MTITVKASMNQPRGTGFQAVRFSNGHIFACGNEATPASAALATEEYNPSANSWTIKAALPTQNETYAAYMVDSSDRVYVQTGFVNNGGSPFPQGTDRGQLYTSSTNTWSTLPLLPALNARWEPWYWSDASGRLYVAGGWTGPFAAAQGSSAANGSHYTSTLRYSGGGGGGTWSDLGAAMSQGRRRNRSGYSQPIDSLGRVYAIGGRNDNGNLPWTSLATCERYDPNANTWSTLASLPAGREGFAWAVDSSDRVYVIQGSENVTSLGVTNAKNTNYRYDPLTDTWSTLAPALTTAFSPIALMDTAGIIYLVGGRFGTSTATIQSYDPGSDTWTATSDALSVARHQIMPIWDGGGWYLIGGQDGGNNEVATVEYFVPVAAVAPRAGWAAVIG